MRKVVFRPSSRGTFITVSLEVTAGGSDYTGTR